MRVLAVDDDSATRRVLRKLLEREGWSVVEARTVGEGLMKLDPRPDWVLLDLTFPESRGEIILWKVRSERLPIQVAVMTGTEEGSRLDAVRGLGPDLLFKKPIDGASLVAALRERSPEDLSAVWDVEESARLEGGRSKGERAGGPGGRREVRGEPQALPGEEGRLRRGP